ncbi:MAG: hypothetical protein NT069_06785 [Planctomycetota bacterium]|nr:hypothetical protein [Planctomycetota bacterium]
MSQVVPPATATTDATTVSRATVIWSLVAMFFCFYLAISVPVLIYSDKLGVGKQFVRATFAPVGWLHDHTPLRYPLRWYASVWGVRPD